MPPKPGTLAIQASGASLVQLGAIASASSAAERAGQVVAAINDKSGTTGVFAYITSGGTIQLQNATSGSFALSGATELQATNGISAFASVTVTSTTGVANLVCRDLLSLSDCNRPCRQRAE